MTPEERNSKLYNEAYWAGYAEGKKSNESQRVARIEHWLSEEKCENYSNALSDVICWMGGFTSGGGVYSPNSIGVLRDLNIGIKQLMPDGSLASESH